MQTYENLCAPFLQKSIQSIIKGYWITRISNKPLCILDEPDFNSIYLNKLSSLWLVHPFENIIINIGSGGEWLSAELEKIDLDQLLIHTNQNMLLLKIAVDIVLLCKSILFHFLCTFINNSLPHGVGKWTNWIKCNETM